MTKRYHSPIRFSTVKNQKPNVFPKNLRMRVHWIDEEPSLIRNPQGLWHFQR